jgi:CubicO group peptidase (beta-lactamase class C family)
MVLGRGELDGRRVIGPEALELMMVNQMRGVRLPATIKTNASIMRDVGWPHGGPMTHTAGFFRNETDFRGMRSAGSLTWAGFMNTHYWVDPAKGIAGVWMTQSLPFWDPECMEAFADFERALYRHVGDPTRHDSPSASTAMAN